METIKGNENIIQGITSNDEWRTAFLLLIASVWEDKELNVYDLDFEETKELFRKYGFDSPSNLRLKIVPYKGTQKYSPSDEISGSINGWANVLDPDEGKSEYYATVEMMIPPTPEEKYQASALAAFMATGKAYPFTIG